MKYDKDTTPRHSDMLIKVCGMREPQNVSFVASLTPMLMGFIFYDKSPRFVGDMPRSVIDGLPGFVHPVALTVNASEEEILGIHRRYGIEIFQLHGEETPEQCKALRNHGLVVFKAIAVSDSKSLEVTDAYHGSVDAFVFDSLSKSKGGSGLKFDWNLLDGYHGETPYLLGGGIGPDDVDAIVAAMRPQMVGIDINSRFEAAPAIKDISLLTRFILSLRRYNEDDTTAKPFWKKN